MIQLDDITVAAGAFRLERISLSIPTGGYAVLMGRTGSGKTTLLEAVCGLRPVQQGRVQVCGEDVTRLPPGQRGIGFVPQEGALFSTMTVAEHLAFALRLRHWKEADIRERVSQVASQLGIIPLLTRHPAGLSGGERQRVALGRALSARPNVLCLDEPLSSLDHDTRAEMCELLAQVARESGATVLHITHDRTEAERLSTTLFELREGRLAPASTANAQ